MRGLCVLILAGLVACGGPSPHFRTAPVTRIAVNGSTFDVRLRGHLAEAIRVNPGYAPRFGPIRQRAGMAMALVSGCPVRRVLGDQAVATGWLDCPEPAPPTARAAQLCRLTGQSRSAPGGPLFPSYRCDGVN